MGWCCPGWGRWHRGCSGTRAWPEAPGAGNRCRIATAPPGPALPGGSPGSRYLLEAPGREQAAEIAGGRLRTSGGSEHPSAPSIPRARASLGPRARTGGQAAEAALQGAALPIPLQPPPGSIPFPVPRSPRRCGGECGCGREGGAAAPSPPSGNRPVPPRRRGRCSGHPPTPDSTGGACIPLSATQPCPQTTPGSDAPAITYVY